MFLFVLRAFVSFSSLSSPSSLSSLPFVPCIHTHTCQMVLRETAVSAPHLRGGRTAMLQARPARHVGEGRVRPARPVGAKEDVHGVHSKKEFNDEGDDEVPIGAAKGASK